MAKVTLIGGMINIKSDVKLDDILKVQECNPDALRIYDDPVGHRGLKFIVEAVEPGQQNVMSSGFLFGKADQDGYATITINAPEPREGQTAAQAAAEFIGHEVSNLEKIERNIREAVEVINREVDEMARKITVI